jgi:hypothetical protein
LHTIGYRLPVSGQLPELERDARAIARAVIRRRRIRRGLPGAARALADLAPA